MRQTEISISSHALSFLYFLPSSKRKEKKKMPAVCCKCLHRRLKQMLWGFADGIIEKVTRLEYYPVITVITPESMCSEEGKDESTVAFAV